MSVQEPCPSCGGSGQISYFKGVSRFLLTCEECPECAGLGCKLDPATEEKADATSNRPKKSRPKKNHKENRP